MYALVRRVAIWLRDPRDLSVHCKPNCGTAPLESRPADDSKMPMHAIEKPLIDVDS
jgi:hypothetical protein